MLRSVVLLLIINILRINSQQSCVTPNGETASCVSIYSCPLFINVIQNEYNPDQREFIRSSQCGSEANQQPMVCCGSDTRFKTSVLPNRSNCGTQIDYKVLGGENTFLSEFPWTALLIQINSTGHEVYSCGGSLISDRYVLTASHCVVNTKYKLAKVRLGEWDLDNSEDCIGTGSQKSCSAAPQNIGIEELISHEGYVRSAQGVYNDIALIRLARQATLNEFVQPICLPLPDEKSNVGQRLYVTGWGTTETSRYSAIKQKLALPIVDLDYCKSKFSSLGGRIGDNIICAGGEKGKDACRGDSGGPLIAKAKNDTEQYYIEGVVSFGRLCGLEGWPGIYTRVSDHLDWIKQKVKP